MLTYSIAIRTLGTAGEKYLEELCSITRQTIQPEKVVVYIAEGYKRPTAQIGREEYIWVKKGMVTQRALQYREISSDCILLLDDDVRLAPDSAEKLLRAMEDNHADCVGADTFRNQDMSIKAKIYAAVTNLVYPRPDDGWAFKIRRNGSFSYNNHPKPGYYPSKSCAGPCMLWKKASLLNLHWEDELWIDQLGYAFGDDVVETYKLPVNGGTLGVLYQSGVENLDAQTASETHRDNIQKFYTRSKASTIIWYRTIWKVKPSVGTAIAFGLKQIWLFIINCIAAIALRNIRIPILFMRGIHDAYCFSHSDQYKRIPPFVVK